MQTKTEWLDLPYITRERYMSMAELLREKYPNEFEYLDDDQLAQTLYEKQG
tara:strand:+ start:968 stop:1120 length:153 start_codon:yes stop_codon:yes gene_type:complete